MKPDRKLTHSVGGCIVRRKAEVSAKMKEKSAHGVNGCILWSPFPEPDGHYFFRVYNKDHTFKDYDIYTEEIFMKITSDDLSLYEYDTHNTLDWSSRTCRHVKKKSKKVCNKTKKKK